MLNNNRRRLEGSVSLKRAFGNRDKIETIEKLRRLSNSFTAPKLKLVTLLLQDLFASVMSLNDLNDLRIIEPPAVSWKTGWRIEDRGSRISK